VNKIEITLDGSSIRNAIAQIDNLQRNYEAKCDEFLKRLGEIGAEAVRRKFSETTHESYDTYSIGYQLETDGCTIYADGEQVAFIEFGTGNGAWYPTDVGVTVKPGSWSETEGTGEYAKYGSWHWKGTKYFGTSPALGFVEARAEIEYQAPKIAKEIFG